MEGAAPGDQAAALGGDTLPPWTSMLAVVAAALGAARATLLGHRDGSLGDICRPALAREIITVVDDVGADGLLVFDAGGVTGHHDHVAATTAALLAAETLGRPVLGWTLPETVATRLNEEFGAGFVGHPDDEVDLVVAVDRTRQRVASRAHVSQALPGSVLWRRLELLADTEHLRWLRREERRTGTDGAGLSRS